MIGPDQRLSGSGQQPRRGSLCCPFFSPGNYGSRRAPSCGWIPTRCCGTAGAASFPTHGRRVLQTRGAAVWVRFSVLGAASLFPTHGKRVLQRGALQAVFALFTRSWVG